MRQWTGQSAWRDDEALPQDFFSRLREGCGCDAVFFSHLTAYYPYPPVAVGWKLSLVEGRGDQTVWKADDLFDAGDSSWPMPPGNTPSSTFILKAPPTIPPSLWVRPAALANTASARSWPRCRSDDLSAFFA